MFDVIGILESYGYIGMFLISFFESGIFFMLPGDSLLFATGILSSQNFYNLHIAIVLFFSGSLLGSLVGYEIGRRFEYLKNIKLTQKIFDKVFSQKHMAEAHEFYLKRGAVTLLFGRFVPIVRTLSPIVAGVAKMNYKKFVIMNVFGAALWSVTVTSLGYFLGREFPQLQHYMEYVFGAILLVTVLPVIINITKKYNKRKRV